MGSEAVSQEALSELLDAPLTEEEVEMNFEFDDYEIVDTEPAHTRPASDQTPEALVGTERPLQQPAARGAREDQPPARPTPAVSLPSTKSQSNSSAATSGTILVSSREVTYSQVGSLPLA